MKEKGVKNKYADKRDSSYAPCHSHNQEPDDKCKKEDECTSLVLGANNTWGLRTFELWEQRFTDDGKDIERVALFNFKE